MESVQPNIKLQNVAVVVVDLIPLMESTLSLYSPSMSKSPHRHTLIVVDQYYLNV